MIDFFDRLYFSIKDKNLFFKKIKFYSVLRFLVRLFANIGLSIYFEFTKNKLIYRLNDRNDNEKKIIISLTSFPKRINKIWIVIESLLRQSCKPDKIILWLSVEQFSSLHDLPKKLLRQRSRGLEIRLCEGDLRSHKKYYYSFKEYTNDIIITVDDDVIYNSKIISELYNTHLKYPNAVCCNLAVDILVKDKSFLPYIKWKYTKFILKPSYALLPIGVGGVLYPPNSLYKDVLNIELFKENCFLADDIWLNVMCRINNTLVVKTKLNSYFLPVFYIDNVTLNSINDTLGKNDIQLDKLRNYYLVNYECDILEKILE